MSEAECHVCGRAHGRSHPLVRGSNQDVKERSMSEVAKSFWASIQGGPVFMRRVTGWADHLLDREIRVSIATGGTSSVR